MTDHGLEQLLANGVIAVVRAREAKGLATIARALVSGGVNAVEITLTTSGAVGAIAEISRDVEGVLIGAGTVLDPTSARSVLDAGAKFVVSPTFEPDVIRICRDRNVPCIPGAFTPTEILGAWR
ncbi:MAG TPA: 2-dehydro-3-deoxyphosphogluconate aldolase, partial [Thermoanaerobaculia bacterium]